MNKQQPILPTTPWFESEVQVRAVIALGAQLVSIALRIVGHFATVNVSTEDINAIVADVSQGVAVLFGALAIIKRQNSAVAPLSFTAAGAEKKTADNPPVLNADPTKISTETKP